MDQRSNVLHRAEKEYKNRRESFYLLLREIITNSIHAVLIKKRREPSFIPKIDISILQSEKDYTITIRDNGDGFTDSNQKYFNELDSVNEEKERLMFHPLGQGRLALAYYADSTTYKTIFKKNEKNWYKEFQYPSFGDNDSLFSLENFREEETIHDTYTQVEICVNSQQRVSRANTFFRKYPSITELNNWVIETFFPFFVDNPELHFCVTFNGENREINKETIKTDIETKSFCVSITEDENEKEYSFTLWLLEKQQLIQSTEIVCFARNLKAELENGKLEYTIDNSEKNYQFYLTSDLFDEKVDQRGDKICISEEAFSKISIAINLELDQFFSSTIEKNKKEEQKKLVNFKKSFPSLEVFINQDDIDGKTVKSEKELIKSALKEKGRLEEAFWSYDYHYSGETDYPDDCNKLVNSSLQIYVKHRERVLNHLHYLIQQYNSNGELKKETEDLIHELFFRRGETLSSTTKINGLHNLWILDDKFTTFSNDFQAKSTKQGQSLSDIYIWADNPEKAKQVLILELKSTTKAHNAGDKKEGMIEQVKRYAKSFYNNPRKELNWDVDTSRVMFTGVIIAGKKDIKKEIITKNEDYKRIPFLVDSRYKDDVFYPSEDNLDLRKEIRIELYSFEEIYELATSRNDVFFRLLRKEYSIEDEQSV